LADVVAVRELSDRHPPPLEQVMVAEFLARGHFAIHVRRMRKLYRDRQTELVATLRHELPGGYEVRSAGAGINIVVELPPATDDVAIAERLCGEGFDVEPLSPFYTSSPAISGLLVGCGNRTAARPDQLNLFARLVREFASSRNRARAR
jgi:GntR family transcriptional regulator/MocR family aminotransferase